MYAALDAVFELHADEPLGTVFADTLVDLASDAPPAHRLEVACHRADWWTIAWDGEILHHYDDVAPTLATAIGEISDRAAVSVGPEHLVVHAAVVALDGVGIALVGAAGAGKSTLAAACVQHGFDYLSDELCCIGADGRLRAYPRPISLRKGAAPLLGLDPPRDRLFDQAWPVPVGRLGGAPVPGADLGGVAFLQRRSDWGSLQPETPGRALFLLCDQSLDAGGDHLSAFGRLEQLARTVQMLELRYGDLVGATTLLTQFLSR